MTVRHALNDVADSALSTDEIVAVVSLLNAVWPSGDRTVPELVESFPELRRRFRLSASARPALRHLVWDGADLVAHALTFERSVTVDGESSRELRVLALSGVCVAPSHRGNGLGANVVQRAFKRVDSGEFPVSLFQTGVPAFYEKFGGRVVDNRFVDSTNEADPAANPWNDPWIMIYPGTSSWPGGVIDLNGRRY